MYACKQLQFVRGSVQFTNNFIISKYHRSAIQWKDNIGVDTNWNSLPIKHPRRPSPEMCKWEACTVHCPTENNTKRISDNTKRIGIHLLAVFTNSIALGLKLNASNLNCQVRQTASIELLFEPRARDSAWVLRWRASDVRGSYQRPQFLAKQVEVTSTIGRGTAYYLSAYIVWRSQGRLS